MNSAARGQPWAHYHNWLHSIVVVAFDLEVGQTIERIYPDGDASEGLTPQERLNLCYLAFPDSNSHCTLDTNYHFRLRRDEPHPLSQAQTDFNQSAPVALQVDGSYLIGFVHFRQERREDLPRGYYQKSVVLLTYLPLMSLFPELVERVALAFFGRGEAAIEAACHQIDQWPPPTPGEFLTLPLFESELDQRLPTRKDLPQRQLDSFSQVESLPPPLLHFIRSLSAGQLHSLWECILLCEPVLVMCSSPTQCSAAVQWLTTLIWPMRFSAHYRPYFTIHDPEFNALIALATTLETLVERSPIAVLGVTNPFFIKALKLWPNMLRVDAKSSEANGKQPFKGAIKAIKGASSGPKSHSSKSSAVNTARKPLISLNRLHKVAFMKRIQDSDDPSSAIRLIQMHFLDVTQHFLGPLERHLTSLMPLKKEFDPFRPVPQIRPFVLDEFLTAMRQSTPLSHHGLKGDWGQLYTKFITDSPNFTAWLHQRHSDIGDQLRQQHLEVLCSVDFSPTLMEGHGAVKIVDLVLKLKERLERMGVEEEKQRKRLRVQLQRLVDAVEDKELKAVLMSNGSLLKDGFEGSQRSGH